MAAQASSSENIFHFPALSRASAPPESVTRAPTNILPRPARAPRAPLPLEEETSLQYEEVERAHFSWSPLVFLFFGIALGLKIVIWWYTIATADSYLQGRTPPAIFPNYIIRTIAISIVLFALSLLGVLMNSAHPRAATSITMIIMLTMLSLLVIEVSLGRSSFGAAAFATVTAFLLSLSLWIFVYPSPIIYLLLLLINAWLAYLSVAVVLLWAQ